MGKLTLWRDCWVGGPLMPPMLIGLMPIGEPMPPMGPAVGGIMVTAAYGSARLGYVARTLEYPDYLG